MSTMLVFKFSSEEHVPAIVPPPKLLIQPACAVDVPTRMFPLTVSKADDDADTVDVPIPTRPDELMIKTEEPEDEATEKRSLLPAAPVIESDADGVVEPIPNLPFDAKVNICAPVDEAITNGFLPATPTTERLAIGVVDPIPTFPFGRIVKSDVPVEDATVIRVAVVDAL